MTDPIQSDQSAVTRLVARMNLAFLGAGIAVGLIFPPVASFFVTFKEGMLGGFVAICVVAGLVVGGVGALAVRRTIVKSLVSLSEAERARREALQVAVRRFVEFAEDVGRGNLARRLGAREEGELALLAKHLDGMADSLQAMNRQLVAATSELGTAGNELLSAATQQSTAAAEQATAISETTTTMEEVRQTAEQAAERAQSVIQSAEQSQQASEQGITALVTTVQSIGGLRDRVGDIARNILELSARTQQIGEITATVTELAEQSNLLAINAAIEAAKAGEHGRGFAVVASEVRSLAEQSKAATRQVRTILGEVQRATNAAVMVTEEGSKQAEVGVRLATEAGDTIRKLTDVIQGSTQSARQIASMARQQALGVDQVATAMRSIQQATSDSVNGMRQVERAARELSGLSTRMRDLTGKLAG